MSFPKQSEIELPLLKILHQLGGKAEPKELYPKLVEMFPQLTEEDLAARMPSSPSIFRWHNIVQWSRQKLVEKGEIDGSTRGVWKLTARGRARATGASSNSSEELLLAHQATLKDLVYENEAEVKRRIISELHSLGSTEFEQFCVSLLGPLGYQQLQVTKRGADRGIDGHGLFRQGVVTIRSAFQVKRCILARELTCWKGKASRQGRRSKRSTPKAFASRLLNVQHPTSFGESPANIQRAVASRLYRAPKFVLFDQDEDARTEQGAIWLRAVF